MQLLLFSSAIAIISKGKGLDPNRELTKCYRKAFNKTITEFGIKDERVRGISSEKVGSEDYLIELLSRIKMRQITRISKLDEKFRVTLPRYFSRSLDWQVGDELLVIPHESNQYSNISTSYLRVPYSLFYLFSKLFFKWNYFWLNFLSRQF